MRRGLNFNDPGGRLFEFLFILAALRELRMFGRHVSIASAFLQTFPSFSPAFSTVSHAACNKSLSRILCDLTD